MNLDKLFGNATTTKCLLFIARYEEAATSEIAEAFDIPRAQVFIQLRKLEQSGVLTSRLISKMRLYSFNPRSGISNELKAMLLKYIEIHMPMDKFKKFYLIRRRPRAKGKPLKGVYSED